MAAAWHGRASLARTGLTRPAGLAESEGSATVKVSNPFSLSAAMRFGVLFAVVLVAVKLAQAHAPGVGVYLVSVLAGLVDVDAIVLSLARQASDSQALSQAAIGIALAVVANTVVKCAIVLLLGRGAVRGHLARASAAILLLGLVAAAAVHGWS